MNVLVPQGEHHLLSDDEHERMLALTVGMLNQALRSSYVTGRDRFRGPIGRTLRNVISFYQRGERYARDWEMLRVSYLTMTLHQLAESRPDVLATFRRLLRKVSPNEYFGLRFEIEVASWLLKRDFNFRKTESPDFAVALSDANTVHIECCSANVTKPGKSELAYKLSSAITKKRSMPYANERTALFIDFTNVYYNTILAGRPFDFERLSSTVLHDVGSTGFGVVCLFAMANALDLKTYAVACAGRIDSKNVDPLLKTFVDQLIPEGEIVNLYSAPHSM